MGQGGVPQEFERQNKELRYFRNKKTEVYEKCDNKLVIRRRIEENRSTLSQRKQDMGNS